MSTVKAILRDKGTEVYTVDPNATVYDAIERMVELNVGSLLVVAAGVVCGIFTERDYLRRIAVKGRTSRETTIKEVMSPSMASVDPDSSIDMCMALMTERRIRHLPVIDDGDLVGLISIGDVIKHKLRDQGAHIQELTDYIQGSAASVIVA